jgi:hypothetical protein
MVAHIYRKQIINLKDPTRAKAREESGIISFGATFFK